GNPEISSRFFETEADAIANTSPLGTLYTNTANPYNHTLYVRVRNINTGCFIVTTIDLEVNQIPEIFDPAPLEACDADNDGIYEFFQLDDTDDEITGSNPDLTVTYHETPENAISGALPRASPYTNIDAYNQTVYVRVIDPNINCPAFTTLELIVLDTPQIIDPDPLIGCDDNGDGVVIFDLTEVEPQVFTNFGDTWPDDYTIAYYETQEDADAGIDNIDPANAYPNIDSPSQIIYIVVEDIDNGCQKQTTLKLMINDVPAIFEPDPLELCDYNNPGDGVEEFDLSATIPQITGGDTSIDVSFHLTQDDADNDVAPLPLDYE